MVLPVMTIEDIRGLNPCYDPSRYLPEDWQGTALDILRVHECPAQDCLWVVLNRGWIDKRTARLFAVWCARAALKQIVDPDPRSRAACDVAERFANKQADEVELAIAWAAAWNAAEEGETLFQWAAADATRASDWEAAEEAAADIVWSIPQSFIRDSVWEALIQHLRSLLMEDAEDVENVDAITASVAQV